jgi:hypothetical protein
MKTLYSNTIYKIETAILNNDGSFSSGLTVNYELRKSFDNSIISSGTTTETNGIYSYSYTFNESIEYRSIFLTPVGFENGFETILILDNDDISNSLNEIKSGITNIQTNLDEHRTETENRIKYILGLEQQNFRIIEQNYNSDNLMTSATIRIYNNSSDTNNNINPLKEYSMQTDYDSNGRITSYKVIEV